MDEAAQRQGEPDGDQREQDPGTGRALEGRQTAGHVAIVVHGAGSLSVVQNEQEEGETSPDRERDHTHRGTGGEQAGEAGAGHRTKRPTSGTPR